MSENSDKFHDRLNQVYHGLDLLSSGFNYTLNNPELTEIEKDIEVGRSLSYNMCVDIDDEESVILFTAALFTTGVQFSGERGSKIFTEFLLVAGNRTSSLEETKRLILEFRDKEDECIKILDEITNDESIPLREKALKIAKHNLKRYNIDYTDLNSLFLFVVNILRYLVGIDEKSSFADNLFALNKKLQCLE